MKQDNNDCTRATSSFIRFWVSMARSSIESNLPASKAVLKVEKQVLPSHRSSIVVRSWFSQPNPLSAFGYNTLNDRVLQQNILQPYRCQHCHRFHPKKKSVSIWLMMTGSDPFLLPLWQLFYTPICLISNYFPRVKYATSTVCLHRQITCYSWLPIVYRRTMSSSKM